MSINTDTYKQNSSQTELLNRYSETIEDIPSASVIVDETFTIILQNSLSYKILGKVTDYSLNILSELLLDDLKNSSINKEYYKFTTPDNTDKYLSVSHKHISNRFSILSFHDITKTIEEKNSAIHKSKTKENFLKIIAHDFKNPLNTIFGFSELLYRDYNNYDDTTKQQFIKMIMESSSSCYNLLENTLLWTQSQTDKITYEPEQVDIIELIDDCINFIRPMSYSKSITIIFRNKQCRFIECDKNMIFTILRNLLTNAVKFTHEYGTIEVCIHENNNAFEFEIKDNGIGIPIHKQLNLLTNTKQKDSFGTNKEKGTGLGLLLCHDFINKHNGELWFKSEESKGSSFFFRIPK
jgi:signal transduction histidine kinase